MPLRIAFAIFLSFLACLAGISRSARADCVSLKNGGEIRGELLADPKAKARGELVSIRSLSGATIIVGRDEVDAVVRRRPIVEEFETRRRAVPDTVAGHWDLADWCRQNSLTKERESELRRVVELDPEHVAAHRALGHIRHQGRWGTQDEVMAARGFVKHKGKYVLRQELELLQHDEKVSEAEKAWFRKVRMWKRQLDGENAERQSEALAQLRQIKEVDAVAALTKAFRAVPEEDQRLLFVEIISKIAGERPLQPLVMQSLWDESQFVRTAAIRGVRNRDVDKSLPAYVKALKNSLNMVVNRAGAALGELGNESVVPPLIDALVTRHSYTIVVPADSPTGVRTDGTDDSTGQQLLPPAVAQQLAAGRLPFGVQVNVVAPGPQRTREIPIEKDQENPEVLAALNLLTKQNFGYDEDAWRQWYNAQHNLKRFPNTSRKVKAKP